jgi:hypothetical protein
MRPAEMPGSGGYAGGAALGVQPQDMRMACLKT